MARPMLVLLRQEIRPAYLSIVPLDLVEFLLRKEVPREVLRLLRVQSRWDEIFEVRARILLVARRKNCGERVRACQFKVSAILPVAAGRACIRTLVVEDEATPDDQGDAETNEEGDQCKRTSLFGRNELSRLDSQRWHRDRFWRRACVKTMAETTGCETVRPRLARNALERLLVNWKSIAFA